MSKHSRRRNHRLWFSSDTESWNRSDRKAYSDLEVPFWCSETWENLPNVQKATPRVREAKIESLPKPRVHDSFRTSPSLTRIYYLL